MCFCFAFDGLSGAGKTTCAQLLEVRASGIGLRLLAVNEKEYEPLRSWAIDWHARPVKTFDRHDVEAVANARAAIHRELRSEMLAYDLLLFDRSVFTSVAYQASGSCSYSEVLDINLSRGIIVPEKTFLFMADPLLCHKRVLERAKKRSSYGLPASVETLAQITEMAERYRQILGIVPSLVLIDGSRSPETNLQQVISEIALSLKTSVSVSSLNPSDTVGKADDQGLVFSEKQVAAGRLPITENGMWKRDATFSDW